MVAPKGYPSSPSGKGRDGGGDGCISSIFVLKESLLDVCVHFAIWGDRVRTPCRVRAFVCASVLSSMRRLFGKG